MTDTALPDSNPMQLKLLHPFTLDQITYTELNLRRMKGRDALVAEEESNQVMAGYKMFAALAGVPVEVILELDMEDLTALGAKVAPLMGKQGALLAKKLAASESPGET